MQHKCPHCDQASIGSWRKLLAVSFNPARCECCGGYSYVHAINMINALIFWIFLTWIFIAVALWQQMSIFLIGTIPSLMFTVEICVLKAPLRKVFG
jgi:uncharacterized protein (DUF983 family)